MSVTACADEGDNFVDANMCPLNQEVAARTVDSIIGDLVSSTGACIQTTGQRFYLFYSRLCVINLGNNSAVALLPIYIYAYAHWELRKVLRATRLYI